ncbi:TonB-dependent receptor [Sphingomonas sp.]|uniref:TonB-dependent receptor n=1 Tax=Sphingomonas sp. TaxID=28214 RepID=UPI001B297641|nr:TonB-dependent receptor [Sphingomonas sp.]MBO9712121.1 TonB-dependent receptor [Sphingomonas sp.]
MSLSTVTAMLLASAAPVPAPDTPVQPVAAAPDAVTDTAAAAADDGQAEAGQDIIVTAQRREERAQEVPIALSVLGGQELAQTGSSSVAKLQQLQPALQFYSSNPRNSAINIRGLGAPFGLTNDGIEQGVGLYVDQVYIGRVGAATLDFVDVDRIEVLRGPQGTLYGKNTTAGAVNITTRAPSFQPEAKVELTGGNYQFFQLKTSLSAPIADDTLAVRLSTTLTKRHGTVDNVRTGEKLHKLDNIGVRGQLLWRPSNNLDFTLSGDFNLQNPLCCVQYYVRTGATQRPLNRQYAALAAAFNYKPASFDPFDRKTDVDADINSRQEIGGVGLVGNLDLGFATLTSVSAWRYWDWKPANDRDFIGLPITTVSQNPSHQTQLSQELRLSSNGNTRLKYTLGAFWFKQTINTHGSQVQGSAASRWLLNPGNVAVGSSGCATPTANACNPLVLDGLTSTNEIHFDNTSFAVFGKLNWEVVDGLKIQPGLRLNYDKKSGSYVATVSINNSAFPNKVATCANTSALNADQLNTLAPQCYSPKFSDWNISGDATISYDFSRDVHGYATFARSFKSGGINLSGLPLNATNTGVDLSTQTVKPEKENHFEVGLKTQFLDRRVTFNLAGFLTDINDYQATVNNGQLTVIRGYLANAGKVRVKGFEWDASFQPSERARVYFNGAYTDAKYVKFVNAPCPPELSGGNPALNGATPAAPGTPGLSPLVCDISGQVLPGISKWSLSFGGEVNQPVGEGEVYFGYDGSYRTKFSSNPSPSAYTWINGYSLSNFRLGYRKGDLNVFAWVRNAFDQHYFELLTVQSGSTGLIVGQPGDVRTFGATVSKTF